MGENWQPIETAPKDDGLIFEAEGRSWGKPDGAVHRVEAMWDACYGGYVDANDPDLHLEYLFRWRPSFPPPAREDQ